MQGAVIWSTATIRATRDLTPSVRLFEIAPEDGAAAWAPGSHIDVLVTLNGTPSTRSYSLVGEPDAAVYRIAVKHEPGGRGGSRYMHALEPGARLRVSSPRNLFPLGFGRPSYLLIAGGIGITPISSMAFSLARHGANVRLVYAARSQADMALVPELKAVLGDRLALFASDEGNRLDVAAEIARLPADAEAYLCGPLSLLDAARTAWSRAGRAATGLRYETFANSGSHAPEPFRVQVPRHGLDILVPEDKSLLDALTEAGVEVMSECRRGECGLCALDVVSVEGTIDHRDVFLSAHEKAAGRKVCACVSRVVGGGLVLDSAFRPD